KKYIIFAVRKCGTASDRPFFVPEIQFPAVFFRGKGFPMCNVVFHTWHVGIFTSACSENYKPCTLRQKCRKVKNVNVG
ncbi:MAG: hypothetical protein IJY00_03130, partial [Bacteroidaceae bacterium]|nr:hypothetical protein [Bacteroidaceae bacterium]